MLLRILMIVVGLYIFLLVSLKWFFPWLVRWYIKRSLSKMGFKNAQTRKSRRIFISTKRNKAPSSFRLKYDNADYIEYEEVNE